MKTKGLSFRETTKRVSKRNIDRIRFLVLLNFFPTYSPELLVFKDIYEITGDVVPSLRNIYFIVKMED